MGNNDNNRKLHVEYRSNFFLNTFDTQLIDSAETEPQIPRLKTHTASHYADMLLHTTSQSRLLCFNILHTSPWTPAPDPPTTIELLPFSLFSCFSHLPPVHATDPASNGKTLHLGCYKQIQNYFEDQKSKLRSVKAWLLLYIYKRSGEFLRAF